MIMQACLGDLQRRSDVGVAEGVVAPRLHKLLGNVEYALGGFAGAVVSIHLHVLRAPLNPCSVPSHLGV